MISVEGLKVEFNATPLFEDVAYVINKKDRIALVGKNGAGKSTMLKILAGLQSPTEGVVAIPRECTIGYLPQVSRIDPLFPLTVRAAVELGPVTGKSLFMKAGDSVAVDEAMQRVGILHLADKPIGQLSGGELQRTLDRKSVV